MTTPFAQRELEAAGFPAATRELAYVVPVEQLAGGAAELELEVHVAGVNRQARMAVGYLPGGPVTAGQQLVNDGETRRLRKQLVKPGSFLVVVLDQPGQVDVQVAGASGFDTDDPETNVVVDEFDTDDPETNELELDMPGAVPDELVPLEADGPDVDMQLQECVADEGPVLGADQPVTAPQDANANLQANPALEGAVYKAQTNAAMNAVLASLDALYAKAASVRAQSFLIATGKSVDEQLKAEQSNITFLRGPGFAGVVAGTTKFSTGDSDFPGWAELASSCGNTLKQIAGDVERYDLGSTIMQVAPDLAQTVKDVGSETSSLLKWGVVGLGLWLLIKVIP